MWHDAGMAEIHEHRALDVPTGWTFEDDALTRSVRFHDFNEAWGFMSRVALLCEQHDHHPEWTNVWNRVDIKLTSHSSGSRVTVKDMDLAEAINLVIGKA
jgi:4a-hydroxytetrahydrobiopterin dehydratase